MFQKFQKLKETITGKTNIDIFDSQKLVEKMIGTKVKEIGIAHIITNLKIEMENLPYTTLKNMCNIFALIEGKIGNIEVEIEVNNLKYCTKLCGY